MSGKHKKREITRKIAALRAGQNPQICLQSELRNERPGDTPGPDVRAVLLLARAYQREEAPDEVATSWERQCRAEHYFNTHGLGATLDEIIRIAGDLR